MNYEKELRALIVEDMERLKHDISELLNDRTESSMSENKSGIICPGCGKMCKGTRESRIKKGYRTRNKVCLHCGRKWSTIEIIR